MKAAKEKTVLGYSVAVRLTETEYREYKRLGAIRWLRMYLKMNAEIHKVVQEKEQQRVKTQRKWVL